MATRVIMKFMKADGSQYTKTYIASGAVMETTAAKTFTGYEEGEGTTSGAMTVQKSGKFFDLLSQKHEAV